MDFSRLQLGTVQFGLNYGIANTSGKPAYESARDIIAAAYASGINTLDTAAAYGDSEKILGRALEELDLKNKLQVISKVPPVSDQKLSDYDAEKFINKSIETSLERLGLNSLTAVLFHREEDFKYISILKKIEQAGLIKGAGVSIDTNNFCNAILKAGIKYIQLPYNILDKRFDCFFPETRKANIKIFTRSLYLQGLLVMPEEKIKPFLKDVIPTRRKLEKIAVDAGISMPELCTRFVLNNQAVTSVLTGVDNLEQLQQNVELAAKGPLPRDIYEQVKAAVPVFSEDIIRPSNWQKHLRQ